MPSNTSTVDTSVPLLKPAFTGAQDESDYLKDTIDKLKLQPHVEGGYFVETDRDILRIPSPFTTLPTKSGAQDQDRAANRGRTVHTLHRGRGRTGKARVETFIVGQDVLKGERLQWIVDGGKYKCSFLLPDDEGGQASVGLLISETVVPGFEYADHDFVRAKRMQALVNEEQAEEMRWMLRDE
ncbi:hypothetical protein LTR08_001210 [Meristemomyces frigidus]|nr:hypothetical protein LTR08_001210 [Meristemomyces frigidus]